MNSFSANVQWLEGGVWQSGQGREGNTVTVGRSVMG